MWAATCGAGQVTITSDERGFSLPSRGKPFVGHRWPIVIEGVLHLAGEVSVMIGAGVVGR